MYKRKLTIQDTWNLESRYRVIAPFNERGQPILQGGDLLNKFLSQVAKMWVWLPIDAKSWKDISNENKTALWQDYVMVRVAQPLQTLCFRNIIQVVHSIICSLQPKFQPDGVDPDGAKYYGLQKMNCAWKSLKNRLYDKRDCKGQTPLNELISNVPSGVPAESWERLVRYRRRSAWK